MSTHRISIFGLMQSAPAREAGRSLQLAPTLKNDVFLKALLEMPTTKQAPRSPLEWAGAMGLHIVIVAALIVVPLYTTGTIHLNEYQEVPLISPPPLAPPPPPAAGPVVPRSAHPKAKINYTIPKLTAPTVVPKSVSSSSGNVAEAAPDLGGVAGGVPGGVIGGQIDGVVGGALGGTGTAVQPPPPAWRPVQKKVVRVGSNLKAPRQTYSVDPVYPPLALQVRIRGTVVIEAVIDEHGNVVQARVVNGHPLLVDAALKAVLQWKYEPTTLNGQPISVVLQVQVHFDPKS